VVDTSGGKVTPIIQSPMSYSLGYSYTLASGAYNPGIVQGNGADWFGPLNPMSPSAPPEVAGRMLDFPSGYNLNIEPRAYEPIKFEDLRALREAYGVLATIIETRKDQMANLEWVIKPRVDGAGNPMTDENDPLIKEITDFFTMPDGENFWDSWLRAVLDDMFVIDAPALFIQRNRGGKMISLPYVDGASIKRVIDDWGRTPAYPSPAYQQVLKHLPAVDYTTKDLIYRPRNKRTNKVYGYSPVEQIVHTIQIALRREAFLMEYYTEGNIPEAMIGVPDTWKPGQIAEFQDWFDSILVNQTGTRRRARFIPAGVGKTFIENRAGAALTDATDEWLTRICCYAFSVAPTPFMKAVNRATADSAKEQAMEEGIAPVQKWVKQLIDFIIWQEWNTRKVEFEWSIPDDVDQQAQMTTLTGYQTKGSMSLNEVRGAIGLSPIEGGDVPMVMTATGYVPVVAPEEPPPDPSTVGTHVIDPTTGMAVPVATANKLKPAVVAPPPEDKGEGTEVSKAAAAPFAVLDQLFKASGKKEVKTRKITYSRDAAYVKRGEASMKKLWVAGFKHTGKLVGDQVYDMLQRLNKASSDDPDYGDEVDLSSLQTMIDPTGEILSAIVANTGNDVLAQFQDVIPEEAFDQLNQAAVDYAQARAAEMVGMKKDPLTGKLIPNPRAQYNITDTLRTRIQQIITEGLQEGWGNRAIADAVEDEGFSSVRAELIAYAEIGNANSEGALQAFQSASDNGVQLQKQWLTAGDDKVCDDICQANADQGPIDVDDTFDSGDDRPLGHPGCRCVLMGIQSLGDEDDSGDNEDDTDDD
jgi:hypothetical protein